VALWIASCVAAAAHRGGWWLLSAVAFAGWAFAGGGPMESSHVVLIGWVALTLGATTDVDLRRYLLRATATCVYTFAALNKLNAAYLAGETITHRLLPVVPAAPAAIAGLAVEGWLAVAVWRRSPWALPAAIVFHGTIAATMPTGFGGLWSFNALMVVLVWEVCYRPHAGQPASS
jgi:hypothetical protein